MDVFFYANHQTQPFDGTKQSFQVVGELNLDPGNYVVIAKADIGANVGGGYPPPAYPFGGGGMFLSLGSAQDSAYPTVKPEDGENTKCITMMIAAKIDTARHARLHFLNPWPLPIYINEVRITAMRVDNLSITEVGNEDVEVPEPQSKIAAALKQGILPSEVVKFQKR